MATAAADVLEIESRELNYKGWICVDSLRNGLAFGGCRFDLSVNREVVTELARCMSLKLASHGLPTGGAKGGLQVNPLRPDISSVLTHFAKSGHEFLKTKVILGKDLGATDALMDGIYAALGIAQMQIVREKRPDRQVPGRLRDLVGYQKHMTGLGVALATQAACGGRVAGKKVLIQGAGAVGLGSAVRLSELGAIIVGMSDLNGSVYCENGLPLELLISAAKPTGFYVSIFKNLPKLQVGTPRDLFAKQAEVLVLAAASSSVNSADAESVKCELVIEGSNFGLIAEARKILFNNGVLVVPDVIASSSSAAMVAHQMASANGLSHEELWKKISSSIDKAVKESVELARLERIDVRDAYSYILAPKWMA